jgi:protein-tyrosine-phosphatase
MPASIHPSAVRALAAMGIDISSQRAKHVDEFQGQTFDYVVTVCDRARENCPDFPGDAQRIHWSLPDPVAVKEAWARDEAFEKTARHLMTRMQYFVIQMNHQREIHE